MISYDGTIYFGLAGDRDVVPELDHLGGAPPRGNPRAAGAEAEGREEKDRTEGATQAEGEAKPPRQEAGDEGEALEGGCHTPA
jgi:hypothetical protein